MNRRIPLVVAALLASALAPWTSAQAPKEAPKAEPPKAGVKAEPANPDDKDYVSFPAMGVKLLRPKGFKDAEGFHGFGLEDLSSSVMIVSLPASAPEMLAGFTPERLKTRGMRQLSREAFAVEGKEGALFNVLQSTQGVDFEKWMLVFGDAKKTTLVTAAFPVQFRDSLSARLKASVTSVKVTETVAPAPGSDVPFALGASEKLKITGGFPKSLLFTKDGTMPIKSPDDPMLVAANSLGKVDIDDERAYAIRRLAQTASFKLKAILSTKPVTVDGLKGFESEAEGIEPKSSTPIALYQMMLFDDGKYVLIVGMVGAKDREAWLPEFKSMAHAFKRKAK